MNEYIAYCGLDCEACEARIATVNNDAELRQRVAKEWSELNGVEITPEMINCAGCFSNVCSQPLQSVCVVPGDRSQLLTAPHFPAGAAGLQTTAHGTRTDRTERFAVGRLGSVDPAADAVDHLRRDLHAV